MISADIEMRDADPTEDAVSANPPQNLLLNYRRISRDNNKPKILRGRFRRRRELIVTDNADGFVVNPQNRMNM